MKLQREPTTPGEILSEEFLKPLAMSQTDLASHIGCDVKVVNRTESRAVISGLNEGDVIALIDPDIAMQRSKSSSSGPIQGTAAPK